MTARPIKVTTPVWQTARGPIGIHRPLIVGILNVTPDSFSDGGRHTAVAAALAHAEALVEAGAEIVDIGGESTRPGRTEIVPSDEERRRVIPVIEAIVRAHPELILSIDTVKSEVARAAVESGAGIINDVTAFRHDPEMAATVAALRAGVVLMHSRGSLLDIASYHHVDYGTDVAATVVAELRVALEASAAAGIAAEAVVMDPGFGFAKTVEQNFLLLRGLAALRELGRPILVGPSRKRFLGAVADVPVERRDLLTAVACTLAYAQGARLFRVHEVGGTREALAFAHTVYGGGRVI